MNWWDRLEHLRVAKRMKKRALAEASGVDYDSLLKYLAGKVENPRGDILARLAAAVGTTEAQLRGIVTNSLTPLEGKAAKLSSVKVTGYVKAGIWQDVRVEGPSDMDVPSMGGYPADVQIAYIVDGESLNKVARDGDVLVCLDLIASGVSIRDNDLVIVEMKRHDGEFVDRSAKRVRRTRSGFELWPESDHPDFQEPLVLNEVAEDVEMVVVAKVLWIIRKP